MRVRTLDNVTLLLADESIKEVRAGTEVDLRESYAVSLAQRGLVELLEPVAESEPDGPKDNVPQRRRR